jgi:hypothetical protein
LTLNETERGSWDAVAQNSACAVRNPSRGTPRRWYAPCLLRTHVALLESMIGRAQRPTVPKRTASENRVAFARPPGNASAKSTRTRVSDAKYPQVRSLSTDQGRCCAEHGVCSANACPGVGTACSNHGQCEQSLDLGTNAVVRSCTCDPGYYYKDCSIGTGHGRAAPNRCDADRLMRHFLAQLIRRSSTSNSTVRPTAALRRCGRSHRIQSQRMRTRPCKR